MDDDNDSSKAAAYISTHLGPTGQCLVLAAVDYHAPHLWYQEAYAIFSNPKMSTGQVMQTSNRKFEIPADWLPSADDVVRDRLKFAQSMFWTKMWEADHDAASFWRSVEDPFNGPLTDHGLAQAHISGQFGMQIVRLLDHTQCRALQKAIHKFRFLPPLQHRKEWPTD